MTLLLVFEAAMESGKLSVAAEKMGLTQSAISHSLKRLRDVFGDELFVRTTHGVRPTQRALELRGPIRDAIQILAGAIQPPSFDPARDRRVFRIAAADYETSLFAPILSTLTRDLSGPQIVFRPIVRMAAIAALRASEVDLLLGFMQGEPQDCVVAELYREDYLVVMRRDHPAAAPELKIATYASLDHVLVSPGGTLTGVADGALRRLGLERRVAVAVPYFLAALAIVARSDLIATVPRRLAVAHARDFGLTVAEPPLSLRSFPVSVAWDARTTSDPGLVWLRGTIEGLVAAFDRSMSQ